MPKKKKIKPGIRKPDFDPSLNDRNHSFLGGADEKVLVAWVNANCKFAEKVCPQCRKPESECLCELNKTDEGTSDYNPSEVLPIAR